MVDFNTAYRSDIDPFAGGWRLCASSVRRSISQLTSKQQRGMWVGIASNDVDGVRGRWNDKYKARGMERVAIVYKTSSDRFRKVMERDLTEYYGDRLDNVNKGGGGRSGTPPYVVYVAWA
jgi:hypothetical protein